MKSPIANRQSPIVNRQSQIDYEAAVQELDGPAEARLARAFAWLVFQGFRLLAWIEQTRFKHSHQNKEERTNL